MCVWMGISKAFGGSIKEGQGRGVVNFLFSVRGVLLFYQLFVVRDRLGDLERPSETLRLV